MNPIAEKLEYVVCGVFPRKPGIGEERDSPGTMAEAPLLTLSFSFVHMIYWFEHCP